MQFSDKYVILPPTNEIADQSVKRRDQPITVVIQLLLKLRGGIPYFGPVFLHVIIFMWRFFEKKNLDIEQI